MRHAIVGAKPKQFIWSTEIVYAQKEIVGVALASSAWVNAPYRPLLQNKKRSKHCSYAAIGDLLLPQPFAIASTHADGEIVAGDKS